MAVDAWSTYRSNRGRLDGPGPRLPAGRSAGDTLWIFSPSGAPARPAPRHAFETTIAAAAAAAAAVAGAFIASWRTLGGIG